MKPPTATAYLFRFFRINGYPAADAYRYATAIAAGEARGLVYVVEDDQEEYQLGDAEEKAPRYVHWCAVYRAEDCDPHGYPLRGHGGNFLAGVGGVGVNKLNDPYLDVLKAELFSEALHTLDAEDAAEAATLAARATFAGVA